MLSGFQSQLCTGSESQSSPNSLCKNIFSKQFHLVTLICILFSRKFFEGGTGDRTHNLALATTELNLQPLTFFVQEKYSVYLINATFSHKTGVQISADAYN